MSDFSRPLELARTLKALAAREAFQDRVDLPLNWAVLHAPIFSFQWSDLLAVIHADLRGKRTPASDRLPLPEVLFEITGVDGMRGIGRALDGRTGIVKSHDPADFGPAMPGLTAMAIYAWMMAEPEEGYAAAFTATAEGLGDPAVVGKWRPKPNDAGHLESSGYVAYGGFEDLDHETLQTGATYTLLATLACLDVLSMAPAKIVRSVVSSARRSTRRDAGPRGWDYTLVRLGEPQRVELQAAAEALRGTHASPRWHQRLGHDRRLKSGRVIWVRPCEVGERSRGGVVHDYTVDPDDGDRR